LKKEFFKQKKEEKKIILDSKEDKHEKEKEGRKEGKKEKEIFVQPQNPELQIL